MFELTCTICGETKPKTAFSPNPYVYRGRQSGCRACLTAKAREKRGVNPAASRERPPVAATCAICGTKGKLRGLVLDHDHATGRHRGWLCVGCNLKLGRLALYEANTAKVAADLAERQEWLRRAAVYLAEPDG